MDEVNALKIRNHLGEILDRLNDTGEPVFISKGRKIRAVLVTPEQFQKRFLDWKVKEEKKQLFESITGMRKKRNEKTTSLTVLRQLRGYTS